VDDTAGIAALCQSLVSSLVDRYDAGETLPVHDTHRIAENRWRALRDGLGGELVDLDHGTPVPTRERLHNLVGELEPWAAELGCEQELGHAEALVRANGAERQRALAAAVGIAGLASWLADETESSVPSDLRVLAER
jgi:glutamate---cysteine ligase / carboxylate-amine ligase